MSKVSHGSIFALLDYINQFHFTSKYRVYEVLKKFQFTLTPRYDVKNCLVLIRKLKSVSRSPRQNLTSLGPYYQQLLPYYTSLSINLTSKHIDSFLIHKSSCTSRSRFKLDRLLNTIISTTFRDVAPFGLVSINKD